MTYQELGTDAQKFLSGLIIAIVLFGPYFVWK